MRWWVGPRDRRTDRRRDAARGARGRAASRNEPLFPVAPGAFKWRRRFRENPAPGYLSTKLFSAATTTPTRLSPAMSPDATGTTYASALPLREPTIAAMAAPRNIESG